MTRTVALRASTLFIVLAALFGALSAGSHAPVAQVLALIGGSLAAIMLVFASATPEHTMVPVRVRRTGR